MLCASKPRTDWPNFATSPDRNSISRIRQPGRENATHEYTVRSAGRRRHRRHRRRRPRRRARAYGSRGRRASVRHRSGRGSTPPPATSKPQGHRTGRFHDVADPEQVEAAAATIESSFGPIDIWVNVAFTSVFAPFDEITPAEFRRVTEVTYLGYVYATRCALLRMKSRNRGTIVQVGSALAYRGIPLQSAYCGSKHAIQGFHETLRCELLHDKSGVQVTMVQLPAVNTPQFSWVRPRLSGHPQPVPPIFQPEVAARAIVYAGDHPSRREYWVGASTAVTLVANAVAPGVLDRISPATGYSSQQTDRPRGSMDNLFEPADDDAGHDFGAHGIFDVQAHTRSGQLWASQHHGLLALAGGLVGAAALITGWRRR